MASRSVDQSELAKLMKDGWSWCGSSTSGVSSDGVFVDESTGKRYKLHVIDGRLTMTEVAN